jgi:predicted ATPase
LSLWRGEPLADLADYEFARVEATRLSELRAGAVEDLAELELAGGRHDRVVAEFGPLAREFPFRERLRATVMTALYRQGRAADALALFRGAQQLFREELGLDPGPGLQALQAAILADDPALVAVAPQARREVGAVPPPAPATPLLGRSAEVAAIATLLLDPAVRLATVLGAGGTGKTRLAVELATDPPPNFAGATIWVSLVGLDDPGLVLAAVGSALRVQAPQIEVAQIAAAVQGGPALLLLDNAEHLLPGVAGVVTDLLAGCPQLSVLVTSRAALHLPGEHRCPLGTLPVPDLDAGLDIEALRGNPAVALFTARAAQVRPGFTVTTDNAASVAGICARLDGLPLALELAAARAGLLEPAAMLARLDSRLGLLTTGQGDVDDRHRSLRATLDWSYRLVTPAAARLFTTLAVFRGGFTLDAAEHLAMATPETSTAGEARQTGQDSQSGEDAVRPVLDVFQELLDASLVTADPRAADRFLMLETILEYAGEKLTESGEDQALRDAHCEYFRDAVNRVNRGRPSTPLRPRTAAEADWYLSEQDNLRAAIRWAARRGHGAALADLATGTGHWDGTGRRPDAERWLQQVADNPDAGIRRFDAEYILAQLVVENSSVQDALGHIDRALQHLDRESGDPGRLAVGLGARGYLRHFAGMEAAGASDAQAAIAVAKTANDLEALGTALASAALGILDDPPRAMAVQLRALEISAATGNERMVLVTSINLAETALSTGDPATALHWCNEAWRLEITSRQPGDAAYVMNIMAGALLLSGDLARARPALRQALSLALRTGYSVPVAEAVLFWAALAAASGDPRSAAVLLGSHEHTLRVLGRQRVDSSVTVHQRFLANLSGRLDANEFQTCIDEGAKLTDGQLLDWLVTDRPPSRTSTGASPIASPVA